MNEFDLKNGFCVKKDKHKELTSIVWKLMINKTQE